MQIIQVLPIIILVHDALSLDKCQDGYIIRQKWINRHQSKNICCKKVTENCKPGYYVKTCRLNLSRDDCTPCRGTTWLADETNSSNVHECVTYSCSKGAKRVDYLPKSGCHMPCVCETARNFYDFDSCNCKLYEGTCPANTKLALNGSCLSYRDAEEMNDLRPKYGTIDIPIIDLKKINGTKDESSINFDNSGLVNKWVIAGPILGVILFILIICFGFFIRRRRCKKDKHGVEIAHKPTVSVSNVSDSGVSFTTSSSAYELDEISHEQQKLVNKIDVKHTSDQTEENIDIKCLSDQKEDRTSEPCQQTACEPCQQTACEPCQQTTLVEINKQDKIVKPCIKHKDNTLSHIYTSENVSKYSSPRKTEKQVAKVPPLRSENDTTAKVTDPLLGTSDGEGYLEDQIYFQRPLNINDHHLMEDNTYTGLIPMDHDFGPSLRMTNSLTDISNT